MLPKNDIGFEIRSLSNIIRRDVEKSRMAMGFDCVEGVHGWAIDYFYSNRDKNVFQKDFESTFSIRRSTASNMLKKMEQNGLIVRVSVDSDARLKKIVLTDKAIEIHKQILNNINEREKRLRKGIPEEEIKLFFSVIKKLKANLEEKND